MSDNLKTIKEVYIKSRRINIADAGIPKNKILTDDTSVANLTREILKDIDEERFLTYYLDNANKLISFCVSGVGGVSNCPVSPIRIFRAAIHQGSSAIVLAHNHPSGNPLPSKIDLHLTQKLVKAGSFLDIHVLDHVIVGDTKHTSLVAKYGSLKMLSEVDLT